MRKSIFHEDWWLDAIAPGSWREVRELRGGHVAGYLRFVARNQLGLRICEMPPITRLLGPVVLSQADRAEARNRFTAAILTELLCHLRDYDHVRMTLDTGFANLTPFLVAGYTIGVQPTFLLDCTRPLDELWSGLRDKTRNVIRRARETLQVREISDVDEFTRFYAANLGGESSYFDLALIAPAITAARAHEQGHILAAVDGSGVVHAAICLVWDNSYLHYFLSSRDRQLAHSGAVSLLLWQAVEIAQARGLCLDFDGGITTDSRFRFAVAFGGELANRYEVSRSSTRYRLLHLPARIPGALIRRIRQFALKFPKALKAALALVAMRPQRRTAESGEPAAPPLARQDAIAASAAPCRSAKIPRQKCNDAVTPAPLPQPTSRNRSPAPEISVIH